MKRIIYRQLMVRFRSVFSASLLLASCVAFAEPAVNEDLLGLSEQALKKAFPAAQKVLKPIHGPHGERGLLVIKNPDWTEDDPEITFYFKARRLQRIEQRWASPRNNCGAPYATLVLNLDSRYGVGIRSDDGDISKGQGQSSAWIADKFKVAAHMILNQNHCDLLVAFEPHQEVDASQL